MPEQLPESPKKKVNPTAMTTRLSLDERNELNKRAAQDYLSTNQYVRKMLGFTYTDSNGNKYESVPDLRGETKEPVEASDPTGYFGLCSDPLQEPVRARLRAG